MSLAKLLGIQPGVTAVIGGGGKTTLLRTLGEELSKTHSVLLCTTTKILPFSDLPCARSEAELKRLRKEHRLLCAGCEVPGSGKLTAPDVPIDRLAEWFDYVLVEADGSAHCPMKAHAAHEPVIPTEANQVICVVGATGFRQTVRQAAHRPELYAELAGVTLDSLVTVETESAVLNAEQLHTRIYINQADILSDLTEIKQLAQLVNCPVLAGSLLKGEYFEC